MRRGQPSRWRCHWNQQAVATVEFVREPSESPARGNRREVTIAHRCAVAVGQAVVATSDVLTWATVGGGSL